MKIYEGLNVLELGSKESRINPTLISDEDNAVLIDTGFPGQLQNISEEINKAGLSIERINKIIITHHDLDHIGSLASIIKNSKNPIEVLSHVGEKPYIQGEKMPIKMTPERFNSMSEDDRKARIKMFNTIKVNVNETIKDGEEFSYCGGIKALYTPGHTPGHTCFYLKKYKVLVAGDAMNVVNGKLVGPNPGFTFDMKQAMESLKKFLDYDIQVVICYHGGVFINNPNERIAEIADE